VGKRVDDGDRPEPPRRLVEAFDLAGGEIEGVEVALEAALDAGAEDLHGDGAPLAAVDHHGFVDLSD